MHGLSKTELDELRARVQMYFDRTEELRAANAEQRDDVYGKVFVYRVEGSGQTMGIWNMRRATPPQMIQQEGAPVLHLKARLADDEHPARLPDMSDAAIADVGLARFFERLLDSSARGWDEAPEAARQQHGSLANWMGQCFSNVLAGEIPWEVIEATPAERRDRGWDEHDRVDDPWVRIKLVSICIKTDRGRYGARLEMQESDVNSTYIWQGNPNGPHTSRTFERFERDPGGYEGPVPKEKWVRGDAVVTVDLLMLASVFATPDEVSQWSDQQVEEAEAWAGACHLSASDHDDIVVPDRPEFLPDRSPPEQNGIWPPE